jgi:hypothetical protein
MTAAVVTVRKHRVGALLGKLDGVVAVEYPTVQTALSMFIFAAVLVCFHERQRANRNLLCGCHSYGLVFGHLT